MIERALGVGMRALQQLDDLLCARVALGFGLSHDGSFNHPLSQVVLTTSALTVRLLPRYRNLPMSISANIFQSPMNDQSG